MKNRASLVLMELLIMLLIFALAAALCLQIFVRADQISRETARRDQAVVMAQNAAETVKACGGDLQKAAGLLDPEEDGLTLEMEAVPTGISGLGRAVIRVTESGETVFSLTVAWQEVD